jgi:hypothetical protein
MKWGCLTELQVGQGFCVPWRDLRHCVDPGHAMRTIAWNYGRKLGRRFRTHAAREGVWVRRIE